MQIVDCAELTRALFGQTVLVRGYVNSMSIRLLSRGCLHAEGLEGGCVLVACRNVCASLMCISHGAHLLYITAAELCTPVMGCQQLHFPAAMCTCRPHKTSLTEGQTAACHELQKDGTDKRAMCLVAFSLCGLQHNLSHQAGGCCCFLTS